MAHEKRERKEFPPDKDIFGLYDAADYLGMHYQNLRKKIYRKNAAGEKLPSLIPFEKIGTTLLFRRADLDAYAASAKVGRPADPAAPYHNWRENMAERKKKYAEDDE